MMKSEGKKLSLWHLIIRRMGSTLFTLSLLLSLSTLTASSTVLDASHILSTNGFEAMAFNLELASQTLQTHSLTIFVPKHFTFNHIPFSLLRYHLLPHAFSLHSLTSLPFGANIPTLLPGRSLTVTTTTTRHVSINNVTVNPSPIFHGAHLVIFATDDFFDPYFRLPAKTPPACVPPKKNLFSDEAFSFKEASSVLRSRCSSRCSVMASVLDVQFPVLGDGERRQLTLFAPVDEATANMTEYSAILRRHLVPCKILWSDLVGLEDGTLIGTYERGFALNVTKSRDDTLLLNGVPLIFPNLYFTDWLVVHGLQRVLDEGKPNPTPQASSSLHFNDHNRVENSAQHYHFSVFH